MARDTYKSWQCPPAAASEDERLEWLNSAVEEGQYWLKQQRGFKDFSKAFDILSSRLNPDEVLAYRSQLVTGRLKRNVREIVGAVSDIRPIWGYDSDNQAFSSNCRMMNQVNRAIYLEQYFDMALKKAHQWAASTCTGWMWPKYRRALYGTGKGDLTFATYGSPSVLPVQLPSDNNWQEAYAITILDELPIAMAHGMFPAFQDKLRPTSSRYWYAPEIRRAAKGNIMQRMFGRWGKGKEGQLSELYIPIRYTFVIDLTLNKTDQMIPMGEPGTSWYYEVPNLGSDIPAGMDRTGNPTFRKANENDSRLYPYRRLLISSENVIMYDGPAFDWHGQFPATPFKLDDWAWEAIGLSIVRDGYEVQMAMDELARGVMDKHRSQLDPAMGFDINAVSRNEAVSFDPLQPRQRVGFDGSMVNAPFVPVIPPDALRVDPSIPLFIQYLEQTGDYQLAVRDIISLAKARAMGGGVNEIEKVMEADGPIVRDISRGTERSLSMVGSQCKYHILQWYDTKRIIQYVGADGITKETMDFDPNSLVPSHMPDELQQNDKGTYIPTMVNSRYTKVQRARFFADNLRLYITPHSVHELTQMTMKLGLIQLKKAGVQIDSRTIAEAWNLQNFGTKPEGNTIWERYWNEQETVAQHAIRVKQIVDAIMQAGVSPTPAMQGALGEQPGTPPREGRPPTGQQAPQLVSKDQGQRSTISESGS